MRMRYVICYDVSDDRRRRRLADCLDGYGDRVQESVFEAVLERALFDKLISEIGALLDPAGDRAVAYPLCNACDGKRVDLGLAAGTVPPGRERVIIV